MIDICKVNKIYNRGEATEVHALRDVDFSVCAGDMIAITGPSGSGKSTLLHIIAGIDKPTSGKYFYKGQDVSQMSDRQKCHLRNKEISLVMQDFGLLASETVVRNICLPQIIGNTYSKATVKRAMEMLDIVGLADVAPKPVNQLSGGQRQRVAIARALTMNADVILADEPTGALDSRNSESLMELFKRVNENGTTMIIVTHNQYVANCCKKQFRLIDGQLYAY